MKKGGTYKYHLKRHEKRLRDERSTPIVLRFYGVGTGSMGIISSTSYEVLMATIFLTECSDDSAAADLLSAY